MSEDLKTRVDTVLEELNNEAVGGVDPAILDMVRAAFMSQKVGTTPQDAMLAARDLFDRAKSRLDLWSERNPEDAQRARQRAKANADIKPAMSLTEDKNVGDAAKKTAEDDKAKTAAAEDKTAKK